MAHVEGSITIHAPPRAVLDALEDIPHAPEWVPSLQRVWDVHGRGAGCTYRWTYRMGGLGLDGTTQVSESTLERFVMSTTGGIPSRWTWRLQPVPAGTELNLAIDYTVPGALLGILADKLVIEKENEKELRLALRNLKARLEGWEVE